MDKLAISFREEIESNNSKSIALDQTIKRVVLEKLNLTRAQGIILEEAEAVLDPETFAEVTAGVGSEAVQRYISFARKHRTEITDFAASIKSALEMALKTSGALPYSKFGTQISHDPPSFLQWSAKYVMSFKLRFAKYLSAKPLDSWRREQAEQFLFGLRPVLKVHKQVSDWLARQARKAA